MGRLGDLLAPSDVGYPGQPGTVGVGGSNGGSYAPPARTGFFNQFFAPTDLPYPLPPYLNTLVQPGIVAGGPLPPAPTTQPAPSVQPAPTSAPVVAPSAPATTPVATTPAPSIPTTPASASAPPAPASTPAASASPVTVIVQTACPANASTASDGGTATSSSKTSGGGVPSDMPVGNCPTPPNEQIVTAFSTNPRLRARSPRGQELVIEEMTGENVSLRMLSKDSAPVTFEVPDGCNAVDFTFGAIELNPGHGRTSDLDEVVTVGALQVDGLDPVQQLTAGDQLTVTVPWRHGSWVELAADRLRVPIIARFYEIQNA